MLDPKYIPLFLGGFILWMIFVISVGFFGYALATKRGPQEAIDFAVAASCLKHLIEHDFNLVSVSEVEMLASGNGTGRVQR